MPELCIVVPTYQEAQNLPRLVERIATALEPLPVEARVVVVDDNSPDGTGAVADRLAADGPLPLEVIHGPEKGGLGRAYVTAMSAELDRASADWILTMDADCSHDPAYLPRFVAAAERAPLVVGSRYVPGGGTPDWTPGRRLLSAAGNRYTRWWLGSAVTDWTGGYNLYHRPLLARCEVGTLGAVGYGFQIELKYRAVRVAGAALQIPIVFVDRVDGVSKIPRSTVFNNLLYVPLLRVRGWGEDFSLKPSRSR